MLSFGMLTLGAIGLGLSFAYVFARLAAPAEEVRQRIQRFTAASRY